MKDTVGALSYAYEKREEKGGSWGLEPAEITLIYNISNQKGLNSELTLAPPPTSGLSIFGAKFNASTATQKGNQIVMKFTKDGRAPTGE